MEAYYLTQLAAAENSSEEGVFGALGIDVTMLILQLVAFIILVWALGKFVYPILMKAVDERQEKIEAGTKAAAEAEAKADEASEKIEATLKKARSEAADIVTTAKTEATQMIEKAESDAKNRSERIVSDAHQTIEKDVLSAREALKSETLQLVKQAAMIATSGVASDKLDASLIKKSVQDTATGAKK